MLLSPTPAAACWRTSSGDLARGCVVCRPYVHCKVQSAKFAVCTEFFCARLTSNLRWADAPGNVLLADQTTGLARDSVANVSQVVTLDKTLLTERVGRLSAAKLEFLLFGLDVVLGR